MLKDTKPHRSKRVLSLDRWNGWALGINMSSNTSTKSKKVEVSKLRNTLNLKEILLLTWYILGLEQMPFRRGVFFRKVLQAIRKLCISIGASSIVYKKKRSLSKSNEWWNACSSLQKRLFQEISDTILWKIRKQHKQYKEDHVLPPCYMQERGTHKFTITTTPPFVCVLSTLTREIRHVILGEQFC